MSIKYLKKRWCNYLNTKWWCMLIPIFILLLLFISSYVLISSDLNSFYIIFIFFILVSILIVVCHLVKNNKLRKSLSKTLNLLSENSPGITITGFVILVLLFGILYFHSPPQIFVKPQEIEAIVTAGGSIIRTISIENIGSSDKNISINLTESVENWVNTSQKDFIVNSEQIINVNFSINIPLQTPLGDYRGAIKIIYKNNTVTEIPILLIVQPQAQFLATIDAPNRVNKMDYFKVNINIKNIGESPVYGIRIKINKNNTTGFNLSEANEEKNIGLLSKNTEFSTEFWVKANETDWQTLYIDIKSNNAGNQTLITKIKVNMSEIK